MNQSTTSIWSTGLFAIASISILLLLRRKKKKVAIKEHSNPLIQGINRLKSHSVLLGFISESEARSYVLQAKCSPYVQLLSGIDTWAFQLFRNVDNALESVGILKGKAKDCLISLKNKNNSTDKFVNVDDLSKVTVPGHWQLQLPGDAPIYTNIKYIIPTDNLPNIPTDNPTGYYYHRFSISKTWSDRKIIISFGGVDNAFYLWCNGKYLGFSKDSRLPAEFDITNVIRIGDFINELEIVVVRFSDGYFLEDQDMFNLSGIFRDVMIYSVPKIIHISDFNWRTYIDDNSQVATVVVATELQWDMDTIRNLLDQELSHEASYKSQLKSDWILACSIYDEGVLVSSNEAATYHNFVFDSASIEPLAHEFRYAPIPSNPRADGRVSAKTKLLINAPCTWSADKPHVYTLVVTLKNSRDGTLVQAESCRLGFRNVNVSSGLLRVNHRAIVIRGANIHEHCPNNGHFVSNEIMEADIKLLKRNNFNAVRTSHYPQTPWFYELCTLYGLYVTNEANIETHGMKPYVGRLADDPQWKDAFMLRLTRMYERDKNHACIICWSLGNESGYGVVHDIMADWIRTIDPQRIISYEPASYGPRDGNDERSMATDILCPMYARINDCITLANMFPDMPLIQCEYSHMMGNSGGNLSDYWITFRRFPRLQGGYIWDWVDQGITVVNSQGQAMWAYGGDFGELEHDANFCLNGLNWPDRGLNETFGSSLSVDSKWGIAKKAPESRYIYGSAGSPPSYGSALCNSIASNTWADVTRAQSKPCLIEAKQCMRCFDISVIGIKTPLNQNSNTRLNNTENYYNGDYGYYDNTPLVPAMKSPKMPVVRNGSLEFETYVRFSVISHLDHIDDIQTEINFQALLLCDGLIVALAPIQTLSSGYVHHHLASAHEGTGKHSIQELECEAHFNIELYDKSKLSFELLQLNYCGHTSANGSDKVIFGRPWPETAMLDSSTFQSLVHGDMLASTNAMWTEISTLSSSWSVVVIGSLLSHQAWAPKDYPMGFYQGNISKILSNAIAPVVKDSIPTPMTSVNTISEPTMCFDYNSNNNSKPDVILTSADKEIVYRISGISGLPVSILADGEELLVTTIPDLNPCRIHLHRAPTDNDKYGYLSRWEALGLDTEMIYEPTQKPHNINNKSKEINGTTKLEFVTIERLPSRNIDGAHGVSCSWILKPRGVDINQLRLIKNVQSFYDDSALQYMTFYPRNYEEEVYLHKLASVLRLGRESIVTGSLKNKNVKVNLWKPALYPCSTTKKVADMNIGPLGSPNDDGYNVDDIVMMDCESDGPSPHVKVVVHYYITPSGQLDMNLSVDASAMVVVLPRIGLQFQVCDAFQQVLWRGMGPHECYPDRKASAINAVHVAPIDSLYVPYIVPSENGNRTDIEWIQLDQHVTYSSPNVTPPPPIAVKKSAKSLSSIPSDVQSDDDLKTLPEKMMTNQKPFSLKISGSKNETFNFSVQPFTTEDLARASNMVFLDRSIRPFYSLNIDSHIMGVGGDDSWTASVHEDFLLQPEKYSFGLQLEIQKGPKGTINDYDEYHMSTISENMI